MRLLAKSLCTLAAILTLAIPAVAAEAPADQATPAPASVSLQSSPEMSTATAPAAVTDAAMVAWLSQLDAGGRPSQAACCCGITSTETMSIGCGGGKSCQYQRTCATCYGCGSWSLTSMGGCSACPTP
jgi:hypothetical protein